MQLAKLCEQQHKPDSVIKKFLKLSHVLKDSLYSRRKTRDAQNIAIDETLRRQELAAQQEQERNKMRTTVLLSASLVFFVVAFFLWRSNRQKKRANALLQEEKSQTNEQRLKAEKALTELKMTQAQLIQWEKMVSLAELKAGIAHLIQNPLNFVNNFSESNKELLAELKEVLKQGNYKDVEAIASELEQNEEKIAHHGERADAIVKGMLQHAR